MSVPVPMSVDYESMAAESFAIPNKVILVENFRFTQPEDILFVLEVDGENVYELLYKSIYKRPYTKANESTAILEVVATVILRCFDKNAVEELYLVNLLNFEDPDFGMWKGVKSDWAAALHEALPKNLDEHKRLQQNELFFYKNSDPASLQSFNFIRDLQWNNMEKEIKAIPDCIFRFWDQKELKERLFLCMEKNVFFTSSIHKSQNIIHIMISMLKIRCKMARLHTEEIASAELNFKTLTKEGEVRNPTTKEEFVQVIKEFKIPIEKGFIDTISEEYFSHTSNMAKVQGYLIVMYKYAGKEIDIMIEHFTNNAVYAFIIEDIIATTVKYFHWNQNCILFLNRGATAILYMEIWKRFLTERNELFRTKIETVNAVDETFMKSVNLVRDLISEDNRSLTFFSELEKSITIKAWGHKHNIEETKSAQKKLAKRKFKVPFAKRNEASQIPTEKVALSSAKKEGAMDQKKTMLGKSDGGCDEEKLKADNTIIPIKILDRPSPVKVYRQQDFERVGRLSRNRAKDSKGTRYRLSLNNFFVLKTYTLYTWYFFSHGTNQKRRDLV